MILYAIHVIQRIHMQILIISEQENDVWLGGQRISCEASIEEELEPHLAI